MRKIILTFPIFQAQDGFKKFDEVIIPCIVKFTDFNEFYQLVSRLSINSKYIVNIDDCLKWNQLMWNKFPSKFNVKQFFSFISKHENISDLPFLNECSREEYMNNVIVFVEKMKNCDKIFYEYKILINMDGDLKKKDEVFNFNVPEVFIEMLDIVKYDYHKIMLHEKINLIYSNEKVKFNQFDISSAIHEINDRIDDNNAIDLIRFVIKNNQKRKKMFRYTQKILQKKFNKVYIELNNQSNIEPKINEMFQKVDRIALPCLIKKIQVNFNIQKNINMLKDFVKMIKDIISSNKFEKEKIIPNQNYQLCCIKVLYVDQIKNENLINSLKTLFDYDLKEILVHESFKLFVRSKKMDFNELSSIIIDCLNKKDIKCKNISDRLNFYSIILQNPAYYDERINIIIDLFKIFFKINVDKKPHLGVWSNELTRIIAEMIIEDITLKISSFSNIEDIVNSENELNVLYKKLSCLYQFTTKNKIFPNINNDLQFLDDIKLFYDPKFEIETLFELLNFFIHYDKSFDVKESILNLSIEISPNIRHNFSIFDIYYVHDIIASFIKSNPDNNYEDFFEYIYKSNQLKIVFSDVIDAKKEEIPAKFLGNVSSFMNFYNFYQNEMSADFLNNPTTEKRILEETRKTGYLGEAYVYEEMKKSKKYKLVKWLALSDSKTDMSIEMNGKIYYIDEKYEHYDIYAEDFEDKKYFIEVKSTKFFTKLLFYISEYQFNFAVDTNCYFLFAFVKNVRSDPQILWLKKDNPL